MLVELDEDLALIAPDYVLHQAKEKFGTLRYYAQPAEDGHLPIELALDKPHCPSREEVRLLLDDEASDQEVQVTWETTIKNVYQPAQEIWSARVATWKETAEGQASEREAQARQEAFQARIRIAETSSAHMCELCGADAELCRPRTRGGWMQTLCEKHRTEKGSLTPDEWNAWWQEEEPRQIIRARERFVEEMADRRVVVVGVETKQLACPAGETVESLTGARLLARRTDIDEVWVANDEVGATYLQELAQVHAGWKRVLEAKRVESAGRGYVLNPPAGAPSLRTFSPDVPGTYELVRELGFMLRRAQEYELAEGAW